MRANLLALIDEAVDAKKLEFDRLLAARARGGSSIDVGRLLGGVGNLYSTAAGQRFRQAFLDAAKRGLISREEGEALIQTMQEEMPKVRRNIEAALGTGHD